MQKDSTGRAVTLLQVFICGTGFGGGIVFDENYGPTTAKCVSNFQLANDVEADGNFGPTTRQMVKKRYNFDFDVAYQKVSNMDASIFIQPNGDELVY